MVCASVWIFVARSQRRWSIAARDQPRERDDADHDADQDLEADEDVLDRAHRDAVRVSGVLLPAAEPAEKEHRVVRDLGMLREIGRPASDTAPGSRAWSAATGRAAAPGRPTADTARRSRAAARCVSRAVCSSTAAATPAPAAPRPAGVGGRSRPAPGPRRRRPAAAASSITRENRHSCRHYPLYTQAGGRKLTDGLAWPMFRPLSAAALVLALFAPLARAVAPGRRHQRQDPPGREQPLADHEDAAHAGRRLRPARHRIAEPEGRRRVGDQADAVVGLHQRPPRAVGLRSPRLGQRALLGAHHRAGQGSADVRSARVDAGHRRHRHRAGVSAADAGAADAGAAHRLSGQRKAQGQRPDRARRQAHARAGEHQPAGQAAARRSGARAVRSRTTRTAGAAAAAAAAAAISRRRR